MPSKAKKNQEVREFARRFTRTIEVNDGDVILFKRYGEDNEDIMFFEALRRGMGNQGKNNVLIVAVKEFDDLRVLSPEEMKTYGWQQIQQTEGE